MTFTWVHHDLCTPPTSAVQRVRLSSGIAACVRLSSVHHQLPRSSTCVLGNAEDQEGRVKVDAGWGSIGHPRQRVSPLFNLRKLYKCERNGALFEPGGRGGSVLAITY